MNKTILAVETATAACSVALLHQGTLVERFEILPQKHAQRILPMVDEVLNEAQILPQQIDILAYAEGPGAFTGVRIASGVIQGLALGWQKPVIGISSLEAMAFSYLKSRQHNEDKAVHWIALMDARMGEIYFQAGCFQNDHWHVDSPLLLSPQEVEKRYREITEEQPIIVVGDIENSYPNLIEKFTIWQPSLPTAVAVAKLAQRKNDQAKLISESLPQPLYLRNHVADTIEERKAKQR
ncbi:tRNA (adenosine(37)-N6)-threonylcarbamoyltransferase complex dimerization subunit type 1 TsaB [Thiomicrorhabdus sp. zzn3]|uniref:tRNA (adenosine(37)-N6)-threonylcarbamoyltransferase complex dimerization subunit type 1 TsaB n=1 Tax=Thiomicrorhabdus sp. zzn3 TaxID=3039775 RepID=UPI002436EE59|nr:tRNA (adenosine(37)-N6)-threonylcarbamoyltransferase complex dimerization subunit type 1 TsaB [Thiomicrorhabdus sp. zzn3]MDG6777993.1 tRNA (adenosine(37)-N6)-threonylcarbamoyltransferase complex dimerization subunit type 1 TsaB [Thiomicrorhabdus sp. zzn3]